MYRRLILTMIAAKIEWNWFFINRKKKIGYKMVKSGTPYSSEKFIELTILLTKQMAIANRLERIYEFVALDNPRVYCKAIRLRVG